MTATKTKKPAKPGKTTKAAPELSPIECKEHLDEVLEMELEVNSLERKMDTSHKAYKEDKDRFELKRDELMQYLKGLNEEHPLFDEHNTIDIPWPFPLPDGTREATLANVASDPVVMGLSISVVKAVRDKISATTLGQLEKNLKADHSLTPAEQTKGKKTLGDAIGQNQAMKLLRAIASFTGNRTKGKKAKGEKSQAEKWAAEEIAKEEPIKPSDWRNTKIADLEEITPMQAQLLGQLEMPTVGKVLDRFKAITERMPENGPPDFLKKNFANFTALTVGAAGRIIDAVYDFEEAQIRKEEE